MRTPARPSSLEIAQTDFDFHHLNDLLQHRQRNAGSQARRSLPSPMRSSSHFSFPLLMIPKPQYLTVSFSLILRSAAESRTDAAKEK
jgi:hypothetical protein